MSYVPLPTSAPIGIFDSGIGGLTICDNIEKALPNEKFIYIADNLYAPYGEQTVSFIQQRVNQIADYFIACGVKAIVIACNTATVNAIDQLRDRINIPIIGVEPAIKPAALYSSNKKVGILVTQATAVNKRFLALVEKHKNGSDVFIQPCPGLVEQIENGELSSQQTTKMLTEFLTPLLRHGIDRLVLGCTHYPILEKQIKTLVGNHVTLLDTAQPVTNQLISQLNLHKLLNETSANTLETTLLCTKAQSSVFHHHKWQLINL